MVEKVWLAGGKVQRTPNAFCFGSVRENLLGTMKRQSTRHDSFRFDADYLMNNRVVIAITLTQLPAISPLYTLAIFRFV